MTEQVLRTLMRTVDMIVAGFFSPAAVAAVGLADIYARLPLWIGLGTGDAAIALSSQDTGSGATANRNEAVTQALLLGALTGIPFVLFGLLLNEWAIGVLGAESEVVALGAAYLAIILVSSPARHVVLISARSIQGTGDTLTPMYVNGATNVLNISLTIVLAFGIGPAPELSVIGIAAATAAADVLSAIAFLAVIASPRCELEFALPRQWIIAKQLVVIGTPRVAEGLTELVAEFPFNAILLVFGTEVNAAYHIGRRMYQQVADPLARGYSVTANILVGQAVGRGEHDVAYFNGWSTASLAVLTIGGLSAALFVGAEQFVLLFTRDPATVEYAASFAQAYALAAVFIALFESVSGALRGGSETRSPFAAKLTGTFGMLLGVTYVFGIQLEYGVVAAYVAIVADFLWRNVVVCTTFVRQSWLERGATMMSERGSAPADED
ncbi:MATE family efflux transporter [Natrarchaeobius halalkaliphilus]|uniref:Multidrug-efflux transporter n=1 Tax=Natrarchaeobius halalkaliphilus TaxID=1679091 RepID=A0A3N6MT09_9EURY|nr:MATE family efflux transporter [Natrarchaeobius halalkaliphilus]RQG87915.1 MATE family efflux transporter [Natrarchaeobius halalkaliphilus]